MERNDTRYSAMIKMRKGGYTKKAIGAHYKVSGERVRQIIRNDKPRKRKCPYCGTQFISKRNDHKYCSNSCSCSFHYTGKKRIEYEVKRIGQITKQIDTTSAPGCWEWQGTLHPVSRYATLSWKGKQKYGHRWIWEVVYGEIPIKSMILHTCDNPACMNPYHLKVGTAQSNADDRVKRGRSKYSSCFSERTIKTIRLYYHSSADLQWLSRAYSVTEMTIWNIVTRRTYAKIKD